jgi:hypothetical protein
MREFLAGMEIFFINMHKFTFHLGHYQRLEQKKDASIRLAAMWRQDPFKAKWNVVARAYSAIHDQVGEPNAPLDRFLAIVCPKIGIITANGYLEIMGWATKIDAEGGNIFRGRFSPDIASFVDYIKHISMMEKDLIHYCGQMSYIDSSVVATLVGPQYNPGASDTAAAASRQTSLATAPVATSSAEQAAIDRRNASLRLQSSQWLASHGFLS